MNIHALAEILPGPNIDLENVEMLPSLGVVGLGLLGSAIAGRLVSQGFSVVGYDIRLEAVRAAVQRGVGIAESVSEVSHRSDVVLTCVTDAAALEVVVSGESGVIVAGGAPKVLLDMSTTRLETTYKLASFLKQRSEIDWIDAPVSGGPTGATTGKLAIMVGGSMTSVESVRPVLSALGDWCHVGDVGAGQATKLVNQILVLNSFVLIAEALSFAQRLKIEPDRLLRALSNGYADTAMLKTFLPQMAQRQFSAVTGYSSQVLKDLDMVLEIADEKGIPTPITTVSMRLYRTLVERGGGNLDAVAIFDLINGLRPDAAQRPKDQDLTEEQDRHANGKN